MFGKGKEVGKKQELFLGLRDYLQNTFTLDTREVLGMTYTQNDDKINVFNASGKLIYEGTVKDGTYSLKRK